MMRRPIEFGLPEQQILSRYLERSEQLLAELHDAIFEPAMVTLRNPGNAMGGAKPFSSGQMLREAIFYGAESAYPFQFCDLAAFKYEHDAPWLLTNKGLDLRVGQQLCRDIGELLSDRLTAEAMDLRNQPPADLTVLPGFTFSCGELAERTGLPANVVRAFVDAFALPSTERNDSFTSVGDFNAAYTYPLIRKGADEYILLQYFGLAEALYDVPFYWMNEDAEYIATASVHRGNFVETFVADRLARVFGAHRVHRNVEIKQSKKRTLAEIDVLVVFGNRAIVVQAKSKRLTLLARKGNDRALQEDFKSAVQDAVDQCTKCAKLLNNPSVELESRTSGKIAMSEGPRTVFPITVVADHYPALAVQARQFLRVDTTEGIVAPLVTDVFALDTITEMLESPLRCLSYIGCRARYGDKLAASHENILLSYHLTKNLWLDPNTDMLWVQDDVSGPLDAAMYVRREGFPGADTPDGILTRFRGTFFEKIIQEIENVPEGPAMDLGLMLLELSEEAVGDVARSMKEIIARTANDGKLHDTSIYVSTASTGLTVHSRTEWTNEGVRRLAGHSSVKKYMQTARRWFGVALRQDGALAFVMELEGEWERNPEMDRLIKKMPLLPVEVIGSESKRRGGEGQ